MFRQMARLHIERMETALAIASAARSSNRAFNFAVGHFVEALERFTFFTLSGGER
jgi:hypothetical protein